MPSPGVSQWLWGLAVDTVDTVVSYWHRSFGRVCNT